MTTETSDKATPGGTGRAFRIELEQRPRSGGRNCKFNRNPGRDRLTNTQRHDVIAFGAQPG